MLERVDNLITYRINVVLDEIASVSLCELPEDEPIAPEEFLKETQVRLKTSNGSMNSLLFKDLCKNATKMIQNKSYSIEDAVLEVIDILCGDSLNASVDDDVQRQYSNNGLDFEDDDEFDGEATRTLHGSTTLRSGNAGRPRPLSSTVSSTSRKKSSTLLTSSSRRKREQKKENLQNAVEELRSYFSHRNLDAIVRVIRMTLEKTNQLDTDACPKSIRCPNFQSLRSIGDSQCQHQTVSR
jgi:dynein heavy chain, axonemal